MKRKIIVFIGLVSALSLLWFGATNAANVRSGESPTIMASETVNGTLYAAGNAVRIDGTVQGDVLCAGQSLTITGTVQGDVLCAAQEITIAGHVEGSVRIAAQTVTINGKIDGSATIASMTTTLGSDAMVARDATIATQQATLAGSVGRDVMAAAMNFASTAKIGRDLDVTSRQIMLNDKTDVLGNFRYVSTNDAQVANGAHIAGQTDHRIPEKTANNMVGPQVYIMSLVFSFASFLLIGLAFLAGAPRMVDSVVAQLKRSPFGALGAGLVGLIAPPVVGGLLIVTLIGAPLGVVLLLAWVITLITGLVFTAFRLGSYLMAKMHWQVAWQQAASLVTGLLVLFIVSLIPYFGSLIMFCAVVWGVGGLWYAVVLHRKSPYKTKVVEAKSV